MDLDSIVEIKFPFVPRNTDIKRLAAKRPRQTGPMRNGHGETAAAKRHRLSE
jgi:hypothetical protein